MELTPTCGRSAQKRGVEFERMTVRTMPILLFFTNTFSKAVKVRRLPAYAWQGKVS